MNTLKIMKYINTLDNIKSNIDMIIEITRIGNISAANAAKSRKLGKQIEKYIKILISSEDGIEEYKKLLSDTNYLYKWNAATNLFPLFPQSCLIAMQQAINDCNNNFKKSTLQDVIDAYKKDLNDDNVFFERLRKIYKTEDLKSLNIE